MMKNWEKPNLEMLEVKNTMWNLSGQNHDGAWTEHISNLVQDPSQPVGNLTESQMS